MKDDAERVKCACNDCVCEMPVNQSIEHNGRHYCSDACAQQHASGATGCDHAGCKCQG